MNETVELNYEAECKKLQFELNNSKDTIKYFKCQIKEMQCRTEKMQSIYESRLEKAKKDIDLFEKAFREQEQKIKQLEVYRELYNQIFKNDKPVLIQVG